MHNMKIILLILIIVFMTACSFGMLVLVINH